MAIAGWLHGVANTSHAPKARTFAGWRDPVRARGADGWIVSWTSNQSAGYCPDLVSWTALEEALDRAGIAPPRWLYRAGCVSRLPEPRPPGRRGATQNVVRDDDFVCAVCGSQLPLHWNLGEL
jgi:hypothetical protein